ncbi:MAG: hypothetical protein R3263_09140, partial [Myxococcota bacterium]|nr:hypothetical protein [Myxococcota bacterium]
DVGAEARQRATRLLAEAQAAARERGIVVVPAAAVTGAGGAPPAPPDRDPGAAGGDARRAATEATESAASPSPLPTPPDAQARLPADACDVAGADALADALGLPADPAPEAAPAEDAKPDAGLPPAAALRVLEARPLAVDASGLRLELEGRGTVRLRFGRIDAVAVGGVRGLGRAGRAVLLVDLVVEAADADGTRRVVRLRSDRFDPRALLGEARTPPREALGRLVTLLVARSRAPRLPADGTEGRVRIFPSCQAWEREVLGAPSPDAG